EIASNVLHNVKNVLNSLNISACLITETITNSQVINLKKTMDLVNDHSENLGDFLTTDEKGKHIPLYLNKLSEALTREQNDLLEDMQHVTKSVDHLKEIINAQQSFAKVVGFESSASMQELVDDALKINQESLEQLNINIKKEIAVPSEVTLDKQKTLQILVNLISNAAQALDDSAHDDKWITIRCDIEQNILRIEVVDNGIGIPQENMTDIFSHGFTTKKEGHGFGLHSAALAAKEMKGFLNVHSDGQGQGAAFTLEIPYKPAKSPVI
ncbi:MAG: HAMP domain-containing histidine kinase, partial [Planctomycetes bacterium]|nr:HAMP domain-containing histidine kinase [Planctomycetota bacterium]